MSPSKHLELDPALKYNLALIKPAYAKSVRRPRARDNSGTLVFDPELVQTVFDEVDQDARSDRGVEAREVRGILPTVLSLRLVANPVRVSRPSEKERQKKAGALTNKRRDCVNWD